MGVKLDSDNIKCRLELIDKALSGPFAYSTYRKSVAELNDQRCVKHTPYHYHLEYELIKIVSGIFTLYINDKQYTLTKGQYAWICAGEIHIIKAAHNQYETRKNYEYESMYFDLESLSTFLSPMSDFVHKVLLHHIMVNTVFDSSHSNDMQVCSYMELLINTVRYDMFGNEQSHGYSAFAKRSSLELMALGHLITLLGAIQLTKKYTSYEDMVKSNVKNSLNKSMVLMRYVHDHYCTCLTLDELAKVADLQPNYLCRYFKDLTGKRPFDYINNLRIGEAAKRLANSNQSVYQIAYACGFQDPCYFTRLFKKHMNMSPSSFRKQSQPTQELT